MNKKIGKIIVGIGRLLKNINSNDKIIWLMLVVYTFSTVINEISIVLFLKILLEVCMIEEDYKYILVVVLCFMLISNLFGWASNYLREIIKVRFGNLRINHLADAYEKIITSKYEYMEDAAFFNRYDVAFDACSNSENGIEKVYNILFEILANLIVVIFFSSVLNIFSPVITVAVFLNGCLTFYMKHKSGIYRYKMREKISKANRKKKYFEKVTQDFQYGKDIRLYKLKNFLFNKCEKEIENYCKLFSSIKQKEYLYNLGCGIGRIIVDIVLFGVALKIAKFGNSFKDIIIYFTFASTLIQKVDDLIMNIATLYNEGLFVDEFFQFIDADLGDEKMHWVNDKKNNSFDIKISNMSFKYPGTDSYVYENLNLFIGNGEKVAIVGENGVGKTTIVKVLTGLFRDFEGEILIGNESIKNIDTNNIFSLFSVVFQDVNLLAFTIAENISGLSVGYDEERIWKILGRLGIEKKIRNFEKKIRQPIHKIIDEDGVEFSGGESQKIALARALYKDGEILILDEPTASLDALAEKNIYEEFKKITEGRTTIFISHRLASTQFCDKIFLIGKNGVIESGTHSELMSKKGKYFEMFMLQGKYYQEIVNE